jgi:hypothetical protein
MKEQFTHQARDLVHLYIEILCFWALSISMFFLKHNVLETGFCLHLLVKPIPLGPTEEVFPEDGDRIQSLKYCVLNKNRMMDNVQKHNVCINVPSSQTS